MHINKWSVLHFPQAEPPFLAGHPGFDHFSVAPLHDETRAVQTVSKVTLMILPVRKSATCFAFDFHLIVAATILSASENYGKSFQDVTNLINNTFIRSEFGIAIGPENSGKVSHVRAKSSGCEFIAFTSCSHHLIILYGFISLNFGLWLVGDPDRRSVRRSSVSDLCLRWLWKEFHQPGLALHPSDADHIQPWRFQCAAGPQQQCK